MPSSTSSSEPRGGALRPAALALGGLLLLLILAGLEVGWRARGHLPSVADDFDLWSQSRARVYDDAAVVLVGGSRILLDFSLEELRRRLPRYEPIQLGLGASQPGAVLRDLAADPEFRGIVIADMWAAAFERTTWNTQQEYVDHFHARWNWERRIERRLETTLQQRLVLLDPALGIRRIAEVWRRTGALPGPYFIRTRPDRSRSADYTQRYTHLNDEELRAVQQRQRQRFGVSAPEEWLRQAAVVAGWCRTITERGGRVVWVHFPVSGTSWELLESDRPRARYWDRLGEIGAVPSIHFQDFPSLRAFPLPDGVHLDGRDAPAFTGALIEELLRRGILEEAG